LSIIVAIRDFAIGKSLLLDFKFKIMKKLFFALLAVALMSGCSGKSTATDNAAQSATNAAAIKTVSLSIEGMTCTGCENTIQDAVTKIAGVTSVKASHLDSTAVVTFDTTKTTLSAIGNAVTDAGYVFKGEKKPMAE
jgi:copper chaperone CopZ